MEIADSSNGQVQENVRSQQPAQHSIISFDQLRINRILLCLIVQAVCQGFLVALSKLIPVIPMFVYELASTILFVKLAIVMALIEKKRRAEWFVGSVVILVLCLVAIYYSSIGGWFEFFNIQQHHNTTV